MPDALYDDPDLAGFYDWDCPWSPDHDWFVSLVTSAGSVLDLGCGTGIVAAALALRGQEVVGVDTAAPMLALARARTGGDRVTWVDADARAVDLGRRFDAVMMTGHAFQSLLTDADRAAVLATIRRHLAPGGRFVFDSRNPEARAWDLWGPEASRAVLPHSVYGTVERWNEVHETDEPGVVAYATNYRLPDGRHLRALSRIAFPALEPLHRQITEAGLVVERWAGDAAGGPMRPGCPDFIPIGRQTPGLP
jgi:SAM-dependent methyltransferase